MKKQTRVLANQDIRFPRVRLVQDDSNEIMKTDMAIKKAEQKDLDLVLVNEKAEPPICKILDHKKFVYDEKRKAKESARAQRESKVVVKEIQFKPNIDVHDFETKCNRIVNFINKGNKVKVLVQFRGRERQHTDLGYDIIDRVLEYVSEAEIDGKTQFSGNRITAILKGKE